MILGILLGNSSVRYGILDAGRVVVSGSGDVEAMGALAEAIDRVASRYDAQETVVGSVRDDLLPLLETALPGRHLPLKVARRDFRLPIESGYLKPEEAGTDRLLGAIAAGRRGEERGAVVVDFGTAVAISIVSPVGVFLGGSIAAGWRPLVAGLSARLPRLPELGTSAPESRGDPAMAFPFVARDARSAVQTGAFWQVAGGARALLRGALGALDFRPIVLATGGDAPLFVPAIPEIDDVVPDLVLEGLAVSAALRERVT